MMFGLVLMKVDFGPMAVHEANALKGDIYTSGQRVDAGESVKPNPKGKVIDLVVPIIILIICCITGMIYTGGFFSGTDFVTAFSKSDASLALSIGSVFALLLTVIFYICRRVLTLTVLLYQYANTLV